MISIVASLIVSGDRFSPKSVETALGITFAKKSEPGTVASIGRYRDRECPFGSATLTDDWSGRDDSSLLRSEVLRADIVAACRRFGAESVSIHLAVEYVDQCNIELGEDLLRALTALGVPLLISCYQGPGIDAQTP